MAWYRFSPTVLLSVPANVAGQITSGYDQYSLLVEPEAKGTASVDGYYFIFTALAGALLGVLAFVLARRGKDGALIGGWAGVVIGGFLIATVTATVGRWISLPDPIYVLHKIAANQDFHATVALHAQGLYAVAPLAGIAIYMGLMLIFTKTPPVEWEEFQQQNQGQQGYFSAEDPYGLGASDGNGANGANGANGGAVPNASTQG